jgi:hypothetical protein
MRIMLGTYSRNYTNTARRFAKLKFIYELDEQTKLWKHCKGDRDFWKESVTR